MQKKTRERGGGERARNREREGDIERALKSKL
jgi:hypothetical protein